MLMSVLGKNRRQIYILGLWLLLSVIISGCSWWLWETRLVMSTEMLFWESMRRLTVGFQTRRWINLLTTDPILPFLLTVLTSSVHVFVGLVGAAFLTSLTVVCSRAKFKFISYLMLIFHPAVILTCLFYPTHALQAWLLLLALYFAQRYRDTKVTARLMLVGLVLACLVFSSRSWWLSTMVLLLVFWDTSQRPERRNSLLIIYLTAPFFAYLAQWYLGVVTRGVPRYALFDFVGALAIHNVWHTEYVFGDPLVLLEMLAVLAVVVAWSYVVVSEFSFRRHLLGNAQYLWQNGLLLFIPFVWLFSLFLPNQHLDLLNWLPFVVMLPIMVWRMGLTDLQRRYFIVVLVLSTTVGWVSIFRSSVTEPHYLAMQTISNNQSDWMTDWRDAGVALPENSAILLRPTLEFALLTFLDDSIAVYLPEDAEYQQAFAGHFEQNLYVLEIFLDRSRTTPSVYSIYDFLFLSGYFGNLDLYHFD